MVAQCELKGVRVQIDLLFEIGLIELAHVMIHKGDGDDEGDALPGVEVDDMDKLLPFVSRQHPFEIPCYVVQDITVLLCRGPQFQAFHEERFVLLEGRFHKLLGACCNESPHKAVVFRAVGEQEKLVAGVEIDEPCRRHPFRNGLLEPGIDKDPFDEILPETHIVETPLFLDRKCGK